MAHVAGNGIERAYEGSLARLGTDHLDLYLLHWPNGVTDFSGHHSAVAVEALRTGLSLGMDSAGLWRPEIRDRAGPQLRG
jgi:aryl-alcohol dehydrogenase-like predicted oxidoreductase